MQNNSPILTELVGEKRPLSDVMRRHFYPNTSLMRFIAREMIAGFKGGPSVNVASLSFGPRGGVRQGARAGRYPNGIWQQRSPDGQHYVELADSTKKLKGRDNRPDGKPASATPNTALVDQREMVDGLTFSVTESTCKVFYSNPEDNKKSLRQETGGSFDTGLTKSDGKYKNNKPKRTTIHVKIPARPHRGIQPLVAEKIRAIMVKWFNKAKE